MKLFRQSAAYMLANLLAAGVGFASVMLLTRLVEPAQYGVYVVAVSLATIISSVGFTWLRHAIMRFQSEPAADVRLAALAGFFLTILTFPLALAILTAMFGVPLNVGIAALGFAAAMMLFELGQELLRARQNVKVQALAGVSRSVLSLALAVAFVLAGFGGLGLAAGVALSYLVIALASGPAIWRGPLRPFDRDTLGVLARYGLPITLSGLFVGLNLSLDRLVLAWMHGAELAGIYGAVADFVRQCAILPAISASMSIAPIAVAALAGEKGGTVNEGLRDGVELLLAVLLPTVVGLAIAAPDVAAIVLGPSYRAAAPSLIPIVAFAFMAHMISQQYIQLSFSLAKRPGYFIIHTGLILAINLILMVPLVRMWGIHGAAVSLCVAETAGVLAGYLIARRVFPLPVGIHRLLRVAGSVVIMAAATWLVSRTVVASEGVRLLAIVGTGVLSYVAAAYWLDVVRIRALVADVLRKSLSVEVPR